MPLAGIALVWFWVGESMLIQASSNLGITGVVVIVGSAVLAGVDASQIGMSRERGGGPGTVVVGMLLVWFVAYPWYMFRRASVSPGVKRYGVGALFAALAFVASYIYIAVVIDEAISSLGL